MSGSLRIRDVLPEMKSLIAALSEYDPVQVISAAASLESLAENHTLIFRLDTFIFLAAAYCVGTRVPSIEALDRWLNTELTDSSVERFKDPPEDFAIGLVRTEEGDRLIFNGSLSGPDAYLQDVLDTLAAGPSALAPIRSKIRTVLFLSNELVSRRGYDRLTDGSGKSEKVFLPESDEALWRLVMKQMFTSIDLASVSNFEVELHPFVFTLEELRTTALEQKIVQSRRTFLLQLGDAYLPVFPTAIADALMEHILRELEQLNTLGGFNNALNKRQAGRVFEDALRHLGQESVVRTEGDIDNESHPPGVSEMAFHLDTNKYFHLVVLHDDMREALKEGLDETWSPHPSVTSHVKNVADVLAKRPGCTGGITLIVIVGIGRPYRIAMSNQLPPRWFVQAWSIFDFERLQWLERSWEMTLWKSSQQKETLSSCQIEFISPDDATLYALWMNDGYRLIPKQSIDSGPAIISVSCGEVFAFRDKARRRLDIHSAYRPDSQLWVTICRVNPLSYFKEDQDRLRYGAPDLAARGFLAGAVVTAHRTWWLDCDSTQSPGADREYLFKIWETAQIWLERVVPAIEEHTTGLPPGNLIITLDASDIAAITDWLGSTINAISPVSTFPTHVNKYGFSVAIPAAFVSMGKNPENIAEQLLARAFVIGAALFAGERLTAAQIDMRIASLNISSNERHMHTIVAADHRDHLRQFISNDIELAKDADIHFAGGKLHTRQVSISQ
jgi:hypothetical protein